jgi:hypothetical protein
VWVRNTDGAGHFSTMREALTVPPTLSALPAALSFLVQRNGSPPTERAIQVGSRCAALNWQASDASGHLQTRVTGSTLWVTVNPAGLSSGKTVLNLVLSAPGGAPPLTIPVSLTVVDQLNTLHLPLVVR